MSAKAPPSLPGQVLPIDGAPHPRRLSDRARSARGLPPGFSRKNVAGVDIDPKEKRPGSHPQFDALAQEGLPFVEDFGCRHRAGRLAKLSRRFAIHVLDPGPPFPAEARGSSSSEKRAGDDRAQRFPAQRCLKAARSADWRASKASWSAFTVPMTTWFHQKRFCRIKVSASMGIAGDSGGNAGEHEDAVQTRGSSGTSKVTFATPMGLRRPTVRCWPVILAKGRRRRRLVRYVLGARWEVDERGLWGSARANANRRRCETRSPAGPSRRECRPVRRRGPPPSCPAPGAWPEADSRLQPIRFFCTRQI